MDATSADQTAITATEPTPATAITQQQPGPEKVDGKSPEQEGNVSTSAPRGSAPPPPDVASTNAPSQAAAPSTSKPAPPPPAVHPKPKVFLKSSAPDLPLHIHIPRELAPEVFRELSITIRSHGGVIESRLGKADLIVVDPDMPTAAKRYLREARQIGQPIPVVVINYLHDSVAFGLRADPEDPKYKFDGIPPAADPSTRAQTAPVQRSHNGRNPYTEDDRKAIISYFVERHESTWSLNSAAKELADLLPTHSSVSFQSYLQANFEKGWNLKKRILATRQQLLDAEPSELQARILRSRYTASPCLAEQSDPSEGWPATSPQPAQRSPSPRTSGAAAPASSSNAPAESDTDDLEVRRPQPGSAIQEVEKSPTKQGRNPGASTSQHLHLEVQPRSTESPPSSLELPSGQRALLTQSAPARASSVDEESDPETFSEAILKQLREQEAGRAKSSPKAKKKPTRRRRRSSASESSAHASEVDELEPSQEQGTNGRTLNQGAGAPERFEHPDDEDSEWEGTRLAERSIRKKIDNPDKKSHVKFTEAEKDELLRRLAEYVQQQGHVPDASTQQALLAKPSDSFWEEFAERNSTHSALSWRSHYLKNRATYKQMIDLIIAEGDNELSESSSYADADDNESQSSIAERKANDGEGAVPSDAAAPQEGSPRALDGARLSDERAEASARDRSMPDDGIVVEVPLLATSEPPGLVQDTAPLPSPTQEDRHSSPAAIAMQEVQWPGEMTPPLMEEEDEDVLQVEVAVNPHERQSTPHPEVLAASHAPEQLQEDADDADDSDDDYELEEASESSDDGESEEASESDEGDASEEVEKSGEAEESEEIGKSGEAEEAGEVAQDDAADAVFDTSASNISSAAEQQGVLKSPATKRPVDIGTPVLAQHRNTTFVDFSIDSDEEQRIRKARSRPSLPNLAARPERPVSGSPRGNRILDFRALLPRVQQASAARSPQRESSRTEEERAQRVSDWTRSVSASPSSRSPEIPQGVQAPVTGGTSRSRASRINREALIGAERILPISPKLRQAPGGLERESVSVQRSSVPSSSRIASAGAPAEGRAASKTDEVAARLQYRADVERFRQDFGLNKEELRELLMRFRASVKDARRFIDRWLARVTESYGVEAAVAFEYVKTSRGDFEQAETFLKLASLTRSGSRSGRADASLSRSRVSSTSPSKRPGRSDERDSRLFGAPEARTPPSKRSRR
ncbi:hypothetical protein PANT_27d00099 [Moesziomyces antarcticus T-34]|uniref:BRCT domain-containing protein n=1 Tax=Pseudozyma antarctica (strain T-34) TaxID=1151754 RepID=M9LTH3_PSEA3|nr:hypothetical protein PANT_27d00099 [Moesziomyces antarcticus T-34]